MIDIMNFEFKEPILIVGLGGVGSKLATKARQSLNGDCLLISNEQKDFHSDSQSITVSTGSILNPSVHSIRGFAYKMSGEIEKVISKYSTIIMVANLAGKGGSAMGPVVSSICKENHKKLISFAIMPFKFQKDRIFNSGIALKRMRVDSDCVVVLDNDALLDSNPDLTQKACHEISNSAILGVMDSIKSTQGFEDINILSTSKDEKDLEVSLKDSIRMLYEDAPPSSVKRSMLYVFGGNNIPIGIQNSVANIANGIFTENNTEIHQSSSEKSKVVMLTSINGQTRFDKYDPLGIISAENTLDWQKH